MGKSYEGTIEIEMTEFRTWVLERQFPRNNDNIQLGVPRVNAENDTMEISFAGATEVHPSEWATPSIPTKEWEALRKAEEARYENHATDQRA